MFTGLKLTTGGIELNTFLIANNLPITISKMQIGDGLSDTNDRSALVSKKMETLVESVSAYKNSNIVRATFSNENVEKGFNIREVGITALDPRDNSEVLYMYDNAGEGKTDFFEAGNGYVVLKEIFEIVANFGNAASIKLTIDPTYVFVTEDKFEEYKKREIILSGIQIGQTDWINNEYTYKIQGITEDDLAIIWFKDPEQSADCEITAETVDGGIRFTCETVPDSVISLSMEVKKVEG